MSIIFGKKISDKLVVSSGLTKLFGIGFYNSGKICKYFGFSKNLRIKDLTQHDCIQITRYIHKNLSIEAHLKKKLKSKLIFLVDSRNYKALRHERGLSIRGQRTHTNARTQKKIGKKRITFKSRIIKL